MKTLVKTGLAAVLLGTTSYAALAHDETKYPDWEGIWMRAPDTYNYFHKC